MDYKVQAQNLKKRAKELGYEVKLTHAQELVAYLNGHKTRHSALIQAEEKSNTLNPQPLDLLLELLENIHLIAQNANNNKKIALQLNETVNSIKSKMDTSPLFLQNKDLNYYYFVLNHSSEENSLIYPMYSFYIQTKHDLNQKNITDFVIKIGLINSYDISHIEQFKKVSKDEFISFNENIQNYNINDKMKLYIEKISKINNTTLFNQNEIKKININSSLNKTTECDYCFFFKPPDKRVNTDVVKSKKCELCSHLNLSSSRRADCLCKKCSIDENLCSHCMGQRFL